MSRILDETNTLLDAIEIGIRRGDFHEAKPPRRIVGWSGAGIAFVTKVRVPEKTLSGLSSQPLSVVTSHAHSAGRLLDRIEQAFSPLLGRHLRWDFYERIAEAVTEYSAVLNSSLDTEENLLKIILREARDVVGEMKTGEFPYVPEKDQSS